MKLSIIIPTKDREGIFNKTLISAVDATAHIDSEIIIVNDSKITSPRIPPHESRVQLINNLKKGVASARNLGAKVANGDILLFLDNDIIISKESVDQVLSLHSQFTKSCFNLDWVYPKEIQDNLFQTSFGRFLIAKGMTSFKGWYNDSSWKDNELFQSISVASFHLSIKKEDFVFTGGYDERFPFAGFEDHDFPKRLKRGGLSFFIDSRVQVIHNELDRLNSDNWFINQERRAVTRKVGAMMGYIELEISYSRLKRTLLGLINAFNPFLRLLLNRFPNFEFFDPIYFRLLSLLEAAVILKGYSRNNDENFL